MVRDAKGLGLVLALAWKNKKLLHSLKDVHALREEDRAYVLLSRCSRVKP